VSLHSALFDSRRESLRTVKMGVVCPAIFSLSLLTPPTHKPTSLSFGSPFPRFTSVCAKLHHPPVLPPSLSLTTPTRFHIFPPDPLFIPRINNKKTGVFQSSAYVTTRHHTSASVSIRQFSVATSFTPWKVTFGGCRTVTGPSTASPETSPVYRVTGAPVWWETRS
jgi:hypothetical protein